MKMEMYFLLALVTAHLLADFVFQSDKDVAEKKKAAVQWKHAIIVTVLSYLLGGKWHAWSIAIVVGLSHILIDRLKIRLNSNSLGVFWLDQATHLFVIVAVSWLSATIWPAQSQWVSLCAGAFTKALVILAGLILTTNVGGVIVGMLVQPYLDNLTERKSGGEILAASKEEKRGLAKGGKIIGRLERGLIFFLVMIGKPEAVAFLVAAKSIFRFAELKDRENRVEAEYITIGTLMSFTWGLVVAWITWWLFFHV